MGYIVGLILLLVSCSALAEDEYERIKNMTMEELMQIPINVSTSLPSEIFCTPSVVSVIDKDMIKAYHFESVADAIRVVAGVDITQTNNDRNVESFRGILQNYYNNKTLLLINNTPTWQTIYGNHILNRININNVERIEILKGPASVLYGTNAYSGVINIITKNPERSDASGQIRIGYPGLNSTSINLTQFIGDFSIRVAASNLHELRNPYDIVVAPDSIVVSKDLVINYDSVVNYQEHYDINVADVRLSYKDHSLSINAFADKHAFLGGYFSYSTGMPGDLEDRGFLVAYNYQKHQLFDDFSLGLNIYYDFFKREYPINYIHTEHVNIYDKKFGSKLSTTYKLSENFGFELGADLIKGIDYNHSINSTIDNTIVRNNLKDEANLFEYSAYIQSSIKYGFLSLLLGSRYTGNKTFNSNISSRATANFKLSDYNALKLMFGESFRTPTMFELYFSHPSVVGNPDLSPETSKTLEIAYITQIDNLFAQAVLYYATYEDLIQRVSFSREKPSEYRNVGKFSGYGSELEIKYINREVFSFFVNYNIIIGDDSEEAFSNYRFVPKHTVSFGINKDIDDVNLAVDGIIYSNTKGSLEKISTQFALNIHLSYHHNILYKLGLTHAISLTNITDSDMLIPEYIRGRENVNTIPTTGFGRRVIYSLSLDL